MQTSNSTPILLCILGNSPMIVPEAFLGYGISFSEVHIITTDNPKIDKHIELLHSIFQSLNHKAWSITSTKDIPILSTPEQHQIFEECLMLWFLYHSKNKDTYVCISGGTKTMPSLMQHAARLFGANDVFHVMYDGPPELNPTNLEEVKKAIRDHKINILSLGQEPGWPQFCSLFDPVRFSEIREVKDSSHYFSIKTTHVYKISAKIKQIINRIRIGHTSFSPNFKPFNSLDLLPEEAVYWLQQPLNPQNDKDWINALPKVELHCHLGGFATNGKLLEIVRNAATDKSKLKTIKDIKLPEAWPIPNSPISLENYMRLGDNNGSTLLYDIGCLKKQVELLYNELISQNIKYAEIRCSPDNYSSEKYSSWEILEIIIQEFETHMKACTPNTRCHVNLIIIVTRKTSGDLSAISRHIGLAIMAANHLNRKHFCQVVGVDLAGYENKETRAIYFTQDFIGIHRCGLAVTAHAGENDDPEGIWQAVYGLHARRIGHALNLKDAPDLYQSVIARKIGVEMCPYANYQIKGFKPMPGFKNEYPLLAYLNEGVLVSVNTDNIGISQASLSDNFLILALLCPGITRMNILQLLRNSIEISFISNKFRMQLLSEFNREIYYATLQTLKYLL